MRGERGEVRAEGCGGGSGSKRDRQFDSPGSLA